MKYEIKYRVVPYGNMWRIQFKSFLRWRYFTSKYFFGKPINFFEKDEAEMVVKKMQDDWTEMMKVVKQKLSRKKKNK